MGLLGLDPSEGGEEEDEVITPSRPSTVWAEELMLLNYGAGEDS